MTIVRWDPWQELATFERRIDQLLGRTGSQGTQPMTWSPALDVHQEGDTMVITAEVAGIDPGDIDITVEDDVLTLSGTREEKQDVEEGDWIRRERFTGRFQRSVSLPSGVDPDSIEATSHQGVIEISVPLPSPPSPHRIELRGNGGTKAVDVNSSAGESTSGGDGESAGGGQSEKEGSRKSGGSSGSE